MNFKDVAELCSAILASIGGGGLVVFGLSNFLGKLWADRALAEHRHKYAELELRLRDQFEVAQRRLQIELDNLGLIHTLRTREEFTRLAGLWKRVANVSASFNSVCGTGLRLTPSDPDKARQLEEENRAAFYRDLQDAYQFLYEEMLFIPRQIAELTNQCLDYARKEKFYFSLYPRHEPQMIFEYNENSEAALRQFNERILELEVLMRSHIEGVKSAPTSPHRSV